MYGGKETVAAFRRVDGSGRVGKASATRPDPPYVAFAFNRPDRNAANICHG